MWASRYFIHNTSLSLHSPFFLVLSPYACRQLYHNLNYSYTCSFEESTHSDESVDSEDAEHMQVHVYTHTGVLLSHSHTPVPYVMATYIPVCKYWLGTCRCIGMHSKLEPCLYKALYMYRRNCVSSFYMKKCRFELSLMKGCIHVYTLPVSLLAGLVHHFGSSYATYSPIGYL